MPIAVLGVSTACSHSRVQNTQASDAAAPTSVPARTAAPQPGPELLYLPDASDFLPQQVPGQEVLPGPWGFKSNRCPPEMVDVHGQFCIDRFEASLFDRASGRRLSPYYHPTPRLLRKWFAIWQQRWPETGTRQARSLPVPAPPEWQLAEDFEPLARSEPGLVPSGYLSGPMAELSCRNAGKRLCRPEEWVEACRGQQRRKFPYGEQFDPSRCNVWREAHPAALLHGNASINHLDPRLNLVQAGNQPLLRKTGATPSCRSEWGNDAIYDMVGNLDEWIDDPEGTFLGGFYSRHTEEGCDSRITTHPYEYFDYSLGTRCCK